MWVFLFVFPVMASSTSRADPGDLPKVKPHLHKPILIVGDPIIQRLRLPLENPRRVVIDEMGMIYLVDSGAGKIYRIDRTEKVTTVAEKLNEPSGLVRDKQGNLFVSQHANGEKAAGSVIRISPTGKQTVLAKGLTGPKGLAFDVKGMLYVGVFDENRIVRIDPKGVMTEFAKNVGSPAALVFDKKGNLLAVNSIEQTVSKITPQGKVSILARGFSVPSDIALNANGVPIVANYTGTHLSRIEKDGSVKPHFAVPAGTIGIAFNKEGNLVLVNWDLKMAVKITTRLSIPCPHCNKKIPVRIQPKTQPKKIVKPVI
jgi:sugar lactone lactonase YvrE